MVLRGPRPFQSSRGVTECDGEPESRAYFADDSAFARLVRNVSLPLTARDLVGVPKITVSGSVIPITIDVGTATAEPGGRLWTTTAAGAESTGASSGGRGSGLGAGAVAGIAVGVIGCVGALVGILILGALKRRKMGAAQVEKGEATIGSGLTAAVAAAMVVDKKGDPEKEASVRNVTPVPVTTPPGVESNATSANGSPVEENVEAASEKVPPSEFGAAAPENPQRP
ncbi:hypothetical protein HDU67_005281, partial [Dinochytrium kinnereticum]